MSYTIERYITVDGDDIFGGWSAHLKDAKAVARINNRLLRLERGIFGDCKPLTQGVWELRVDHGPGYRVYYSVVGKTIVLLLCAGDKRKQDSDILRAVEYLKDYKRRRS